jgi:arylsulfatase A-like enzyme
MRVNSMNRREFLVRAGACLSTGVLASWAPSGRAMESVKRPNIVLILVDDMGWIDCTVYGSRYYETPNIERLADFSVRFTDAYAAAPLCTASRAAIMTGKYPGRLGITGADGHLPGGSHLLPEEYTLGEALRDNGYRTGFIGKWHLGCEEKHWPEHHGFEVNIGGGKWPGPPSHFSPYHISNLPDGPAGEYLTDRLTDEAIDFIDESGDQPFFLDLSHYAVHPPFQAKAEYQHYFEGKKDPRGAQHNAVMAAMLKSLDVSVGRLLDHLEARGLMENTAIIFTSDNGGDMFSRITRTGEWLGAWAPEGRMPTNNTPLRLGKGSTYEGGIRVPALVYWPGVAEREAVSHEVISGIDIYPTILDMLGIEPKPGQVIDGVSIAPALKGGRLRREAVYGHYPHSVVTVPAQKASWVRKGDWKLIRFYEQDEYYPDRIELYNLKDDISEMHNLAQERPRRARELEQMLVRHLEETGAMAPGSEGD